MHVWVFSSVGKDVKCDRKTVTKYNKYVVRDKEQATVKTRHHSPNALLLMILVLVYPLPNG